MSKLSAFVGLVGVVIELWHLVYWQLACVTFVLDLHVLLYKCCSASQPVVLRRVITMTYYYDKRAMCVDVVGVGVSGADAADIGRQRHLCCCSWRSPADDATSPQSCRT